jgi:hypothetical protein
MFCKPCSRILTNNLQQFESNRMKYAFSPDEDYQCEECSARERAQECANVIKADLAVKKAKIGKVTMFEEDKFAVTRCRVRDYWVDRSTPTDVKKGKYPIWLEAFKRFVNEFLEDRPAEQTESKLK